MDDIYIRLRIIKGGVDCAMVVNSIQSTTSQVGQSNQNSIATLQKEKQKTLDEIKQLQTQDPKSNEKQIQLLQQQVMQFEMQIQQQTQKNNDGENAGSNQKVGPAYTLHLGEKSSSAANASSAAVPIEEMQNQQQTQSFAVQQGQSNTLNVGPAYIVKLEQHNKSRSNKNPDATTSETI